jgi:hypothetical protein
MTPATPTRDLKPIPELMWKQLAELDERISIRIHAALNDHKNEIVEIGNRFGFTEKELKDRGVLIMTAIGTAAAGQAARRE